MFFSHLKPWGTKFYLLSVPITAGNLFYCNTVKSFMNIYQRHLHGILIKSIYRKAGNNKELIFQEQIIHWVIVNLHLCILQPLTSVKENIDEKSDS